MLNIDRIQTMTKLHRLEEGPDSDYLKVNQVYRSDYIGMALIKNFIAVTFAYILLLAVGGLYHFEFLATQWFNLDLQAVIVNIIKWYVVIVVVYSVIVYILCSARYVKMKKYVKAYDEELKKLEEQYDIDDGMKDISIGDRRG